MVELAHAYVQIVPSMSGVGRAIQDAFGSAGDKGGAQAGKNFTSGFSAKIGAVAGVTASVFNKVAGVVSGLSGQILDASDSTQKFAQTLDFAGVGADQIKKLTASTQEYANKTVYGIDDIRNTTAQLAANGVPNYDKLAEAAGNLNAVAGGNSETFKSVAMMLTQTAGAGKLTTENWNQLADAIPGASGKLQEAMLKNGAYTGNFRDAMAKGEITSQEFNDALMQLGMNDGAIKAAESTQTFEGAFGNLEATIVDGVANIVNTVKPYITGAVTALGDGIGKAMQWVNDFTGALMKSQGVQTFANGVKSIAGAVGSIIGPIAIAVGGLFGFTGGTDSAKDAAQRLSDILGIIGGVLQSVGTFVQQNTAWLTPLAVAIMAAYGAFVMWNGAIALWQTATKIATGVQAAFNMVMNANPIMLLVTAIAALAAGLAYFFTQTETGRQMWAAFTSWLTDTWNTIVTTAQDLWNGLGEFLANLWATISGGVQSAWDGIKAFLSNILDGIKSIWTSVWTAVSQFFTDVWNRIVAFFTPIINGIRNTIGNVLNAISGVWTSVWNSVSSYLSNIWHGITSAVSNGIQSVSNTVGRIRDTVLGAVSGAGRWLYDTGRQVISGLINGIGGAFGWVRNTISNLGSSLVGWAKGVLGIHSPSRIFRDEVGKWIPAGMAQGIDKASGLVEDSIDGLTDMIPTVSLKTDTSMLETPYAYQTRITGGRMAYTIDSSQGEYATKQDIIDAIDQALSSGITLNLSDRGGEVMAGKLAKPMSYELNSLAMRGR